MHSTLVGCSIVIQCIWRHRTRSVLLKVFKVSEFWVWNCIYQYSVIRCTDVALCLCSTGSSSQPRSLLNYSITILTEGYPSCSFSITSCEKVSWCFPFFVRSCFIFNAILSSINYSLSSPKTVRSTSWLLMLFSWRFEEFLLLGSESSLYLWSPPASKITSLFIVYTISLISFIWAVLRRIKQLTYVASVM